METLEYTLQQHNANDTIGNMEFSYFRRNVLINLAIDIFYTVLDPRIRY